MCIYTPWEQGSFSSARKWKEHVDKDAKEIYRNNISIAILLSPWEWLCSCRYHAIIVLFLTNRVSSPLHQWKIQFPLIRWLFFTIFCFLFRLYCGVFIAVRTLIKKKKNVPPKGQGRNLSSVESQNSRPLIPPHFLQIQPSSSSHNAKSTSHAKCLHQGNIIRYCQSEWGEVSCPISLCLCFLYAVVLALEARGYDLEIKNGKGFIWFHSIRLGNSFGYKHKEK